MKYSILICGGHWTIDTFLPGRVRDAIAYASAGNSDRYVSVRLSVRPSRAGVLQEAVARIADRTAKNCRGHVT